MPSIHAAFRNCSPLVVLRPSLSIMIRRSYLPRLRASVLEVWGQTSALVWSTFSPCQPFRRPVLAAGTRRCGLVQQWAATGFSVQSQCHSASGKVALRDMTQPTLTHLPAIPNPAAALTKCFTNIVSPLAKTFSRGFENIRFVCGNYCVNF